MSFVFILAGLAALFWGGDALVRGASGLARRLSVSPMLIGLVIVGFGTSAPELTTSIAAAVRGSSAVAAGNVVGSNIANILLILGVAALVAPMAVNARALRRDGSVLIAATLGVALLLAFTVVGPIIGAALAATLLAYVVITARTDRKHGGAPAELHAAEAELAPATRSGGRAGLALLLGLIGVIAGAALLVEGAVTLARAAGVSEAVIGLTVVAVGTSLPELAASITAARRGESDIALGNIIGSNLFNALGILGVTAMVRSFPAGAGLAMVDLAVMVAAALILVVFAATGRRIDRREGAVLLAGYAAYVGWTTLMSAG